MSSISTTGMAQSDVFSKPVNTATSLVLSEEKISQIKAGETPAIQLSQEATEKSQQALLQSRNSIIALTKSQTNAVTNDVDTFFSGMLTHSTASSADMGGLISEALQTPGGSGNSTTNSMDLSLTQAKLNYLVEKFVPAEYQAATRSEINNYVTSKATGQDEILKDMTSRSLAIAQQYGDQEGVKNFSQQLDLLSSGQHETQTERSAMLSLTNSTSDSSSWFSGLHQMVNENDDADFFKSIESSHITQLQQQWEKFTSMVNSFSS
ncbi:hypothetical protein [Erwinia mallotivora]|uniref:Uncharacterized protein n=1 Tax=Erwinia mallotivora TaxID=69222 RepID=A0A014N3Z1_9GAMM|nr:hypothetical protein [Erwinia mallotivora]EXU74123.1 hypothetical protein BG55_19060 [Erwinia mallotivora]